MLSDFNDLLDSPYFIRWRELRALWPEGVWMIIVHTARCIVSRLIVYGYGPKK